MNALHIEGLRVQVGGRVLLQVPLLTVAHGERVVVVGANGAGKSTLLRCLSGFVTPTAGRVEVLGRLLASPLRPRPLPRPAQRALRAEIGQLLQGLHLVARSTVLQNTLVGALGRLHGVHAWRSWWHRFPADEVVAAQHALHAVGMAGRAHERVDRLSGGERQKVAMARLLLQRPRLVLADEPTASLDPAAAHAACALLSQAAHGTTLITIVHDPALVPLLGQRVLGLRAGCIVFDGPAHTLDASALAALYGSPTDGTGEPMPQP